MKTSDRILAGGPLSSRPTSNVPIATRIGIPFLTNSLPFTVFGAIIGIFWMGHYLHQAFEVFPILSSALLVFISVIWIITLGERAIMAEKNGLDTETATTGIIISMVFAIGMFFIGLVAFYNTWQGAHPAHYPPPNCLSDGGVAPGWPKVLEQGEYHSQYVRVVCKSGYGFNQSSDN